jgi:hypothetical protein
MKPALCRRTMMDIISPMLIERHQAVFGDAIKQAIDERRSHLQGVTFTQRAGIQVEEVHAPISPAFR